MGLAVGPVGAESGADRELTIRGGGAFMGPRSCKDEGFANWDEWAADSLCTPQEPPLKSREPALAAGYRGVNGEHGQRTTGSQRARSPGSRRLS